jgi:DNA-binding CsgD family transcriptional regulator
MVPRDAVLGALVGLVDKSVVLRVADVGGAARYRLLAAAREYGAAQATGAAATAGRHRHHYLGRARAAADAFAGPAQLRLVDELGRDEANLRLAFDGALAAGDAATAGGLAVACWPWLVCTGRLAQARSWLARARADPPRRQRRTDHPERGRGSARPVPFPPAGWPSPDPAPGPADARVLLAWVLSAQGDPAAADALPEPGERDEGGRDAPAASGSPLAAGHLGAVAAALTDVLAALRLGALADCRRRGTVLADSLPDGERWARGWASWAGAVAAWCDGANPAAGPGLRAGLELLAPFGDEFAVAQHLEALGWLAARCGDGRRTARLQGAADRMWRDLVASGQVRAPRSGLLLLDVERDQAERHARDDLGEAGYAAEYATGAELRTAAAVSLALPGLASPYRAADAERAPRARPEAQQRALAALAAAPGHRTSRLREHAGGDAGARPAEGSAGAAEGSAGAAGGDCGAAGEDTADVGAAAAGRDLDARPAGVGRASGPGPGDVSAEAVSRAHWELLTAREREVAVLVAAGRTNRDIAARLVVSKRTVDAHVEHILGKLGYSSRVQVAALASAREQAGLARHGAAPGGRLPSGGPQPGGAASGGARPGGASPGRPR